MKYLCLAYYDEKKFEALSAGEVEALVSQCPAHDAELRKTGRLIGVGSLGPTRMTRSLRPDNGKASMTDGPFAETKEQIGAFFIIEAENLDEAARLASLHPAARLGSEVGWGVEVRPIESYEPRV